MTYLIVLCGLLAALLAALGLKIYLLRRAAKEIAEQMADKLSQETNTLITLSSQDKAMQELAAALNVQLARLRSQRHRFVQGDSELKQAVTNISHDLRTPLTAINGYLQLLEQEPMSETVQQYFSIIQERTAAMKALTEELFSYSVIVSAEETLTIEPVSLQGALEESLAAFYGALTGRGITPQIEMPETHVIRNLDRRAVNRILGNILSNAVKYAANGDLSICLTTAGMMTFSNAAPTLTPVEAEKLFDRFYTVNSARNSTGLGLSIIYGLVKDFGGSISARNRDEGGALFEIRLPITRRGDLAPNAPADGNRAGGVSGPQPEQIS